MKIPGLSSQKSNNSETKEEDISSPSNNTSTFSKDLSEEEKLSAGIKNGLLLNQELQKNQIETDFEIDEDSFFSEDTVREDSFFRIEENGNSTTTTKYDMEKILSNSRKNHFKEIDRYWVNKPYAFVSIFHSQRENEVKYYVFEPYLTDVEKEILDFLESKVRDKIKYTQSDEIAVDGDKSDKEEVIERVTKQIMEEFKLNTGSGLNGILAKIGNYIYKGGTAGVRFNSEKVDLLTEQQVEKFLYYIKRDFIGYGKIDPIKKDIAVEDISCNGYNSSVFVYHTEYEQIITNISHEKEELDKFVINLAKRGGKSISKRTPQVDITLDDGSRGQLTYGSEVSSHGTNYTIRQFKDVPFTPTDLISWNTFDLDQMAFLWLCIQNNKSMIIAGGTASGKTTTLNALSLFIPSSSKIVSIEDTREVELPQKNWVASITRPSFKRDGGGSVDEFDLLESALRQRPDYLIMGEVRGEEGRTLFQVMSTGHTTYSTFHADNVGQVLRRFTTDPINVSKSIFSSVDLVSIQTSTRVDGNKVRRCKTISEIVEYNSEDDNIIVQDIYEWIAEDDMFRQTSGSNLMDQIKFDRGWSESDLTKETAERKVVLAYLIKNEFKSYKQVAATLQAYMTDPATVITLIAEDRLKESLEDLSKIETIDFRMDETLEDLNVRPSPDEKLVKQCEQILEENEDWLSEYRNRDIFIDESQPDLTHIFESQEVKDKNAIKTAEEEKTEFDRTEWDALEDIESKTLDSGDDEL